jgi:hypothetical protein
LIPIAIDRIVIPIAIDRIVNFHAEVGCCVEGAELFKFFEWWAVNRVRVESECGVLDFSRREMEAQRTQRF